MPTIGRALAFWIKYWDEMEALYWRDDESLAGDDRTEMVELVGTVGDQALQEVRNFLLECGRRIEATLGEQCNLRRAQREETLLRLWQVEFWIWPKRRKLRGNRGWKIGTGLWKSRTGPVLATWLWGKGGRAAEERGIGVLGLPEVAKVSGFDPGHLVLGQVALPVPTDQKFDIDAEPILESVASMINVLTRERVEMLFDDGE